jgi:hypothetical protein
MTKSLGHACFSAIAIGAMAMLGMHHVFASFASTPPVVSVRVQRDVSMQIALSRLRYCSSSDDIYTVEMLFTAKYTNTSGRPIHVALGSETGSVTIVAKTYADMQREHYVARFEAEGIPMDENVAFSLVRPRDVFSGHTTGFMVVTRNPHSRHDNQQLLTPGHYVIAEETSIKVLDDTNNDSDRASRWLLLRSQNVAIDVALNPHLLLCDKPIWSPAVSK